MGIDWASFTHAQNCFESYDNSNSNSPDKVIYTYTLMSGLFEMSDKKDRWTFHEFLLN